MSIRSDREAGSAMAIIAVQDIPEEPRPLSQRDMIRKDIREAMENGISQFEFIGDAYRYNTLITNAKETLRLWFHREVYFPASRRAKERLKSQIKEPFWTPMAQEYDSRAFSLTRRKLGDRVHVYCFLNLDMIKNMEQVICDDTLKEYSKKHPGQIIGRPERAP